MRLQALAQCCGNATQGERYLPPGTRVTYNGHRATVVDIDETHFGLYPPGHPWACPDYAEPIQFDGTERATWVRRSCLQVDTTPLEEPSA